MLCIQSNENLSDLLSSERLNAETSCVGKGPAPWFLLNLRCLYYHLHCLRFLVTRRGIIRNHKSTECPICIRFAQIYRRLVVYDKCGLHVASSLRRRKFANIGEPLASSTVNQPVPSICLANRVLYGDTVSFLTCPVKVTVATCFFNKHIELPWRSA